MCVTRDNGYKGNDFPRLDQYPYGYFAVTRDVGGNFPREMKIFPLGEKSFPNGKNIFYRWEKRKSSSRNCIFSAVAGCVNSNRSACR